MNISMNLIQSQTYREIAGWLDRLPHALLLHGPRGVGKLQLAERLGQRFLCEARNPGLEPCGRCNGCRWSMGGQHPDLRFVEPEALARATGVPGKDDENPRKESREKAKPSLEIRIEQVRALEDFVHLGSHRGKRRVIVVHPAENMNLPTASALLKNLEEPPPGAVFMLVSHRPARLLPTIRSRCIQVAVPLPEKSIAIPWLETQGVADAASWLAFAGGAPLLALDCARDERAALVTGWRKALDDGALDSIQLGAEREDAEFLVDFLQKHALDAALASAGLPPRFGTGPARVSRSLLRGWLTYARNLGQARKLARHPLNPRLFVAEVLDKYPARCE
jgi:DNA polymerase-3 subunit delta'